MVYPGRILLGVDSRVSYTDKTGKRFFSTGCKIFETNKTIYTFAGYAGSYGNYSTGSKNFNTQLYVKSFLDRQNKTILQNLEELKRGLAKEHIREFKIMEKVNPEKYLIEKEKNNPLSLVVIATNINGPFLYSLDATFDKSTNRIKVEGSVSQNVREITGFEAAAIISNYHKAHPFVLNEEPVQLIDKLMEVAISDKRFEVGKPISIVEVTAKDVNWIRRNSYRKRYKKRQ